MPRQAVAVRATITPPQEMTRYEFVSHCRDVDEAVDWLLELPRNSSLLRQFVEVGVKATIDTRIKKNRSMARSGHAEKIKNVHDREDALAWKQQNDEFNARKFDGLFEAILEAHRDSILNTWKVGRDQRPLGTLTPEELRSSATDERARAKGHWKNATYFDKLARLGTPGTPIGKSVSPAKAEQLWKQISTRK